MNLIFKKFKKEKIGRVKLKKWIYTEIGVGDQGQKKKKDRKKHVCVMCA